MKFIRNTVKYKDGREDSDIKASKTGKQFPFDLVLFFSVLSLILIGVVMVYSSSSAIAAKNYGTDYYFLKRQAIFAIAGFVVMAFVRFIPFRLYKTMTYPIMILSIGLLIAIHVTGFGYTAGGATRWIKFGAFSFQPSELARFALVVYLSYSLSKKKELLKKFSIGIVPHAIVLGIFIFLIFLQPDFGSVLILTAITWIMLYVGGVRLKHLLLPMLGLLPVFYVLMMTAEYRLRRILTFLNPWDYSTGDGYQIVHSLMAFGSGGLFGAGVGKGYQKLFYLPEPHTDFIFSVIGEELGLLGVIVILFLYISIFMRGLSIAKKADNDFAGLMALGIALSFGFQVCINLGVCLGLLPTKGLALPFLSYGGTSLLMNMAAIGVLMNIGGNRSI